MEKFIFGSISISFPLLLTQKKMFFRPQDGSSRPFEYFIHLKLVLISVPVMFCFHFRT